MYVEGGGYLRSCVLHIFVRPRQPWLYLPLSQVLPTVFGDEAEGNAVDSLLHRRWMCLTRCGPRTVRCTCHPKRALSQRFGLTALTCGCDHDAWHYQPLLELLLLVLGVCTSTWPSCVEPSKAA